MLIRMLLKVFLLLSLSIGICLPSAYALWSYTKGVDEVECDIDTISLGEFIYLPEEVLPGDKESTNLHENHLELLINIIDHLDYGLNATKKPIVRNLLEDGAAVVYSNQNVSGGNLKHMLLDSSDVENLMFCVEYSTDTEYNVYTFSSLKVNSANVNVYIDVYKSIVQYNGTKWEAVRSFYGTAMIDAVYTFDHQQVVSIDVKTWK